MEPEIIFGNLKYHYQSEPDIRAEWLHMSDYQYEGRKIMILGDIEKDMKKPRRIFVMNDDSKYGMYLAYDTDSYVFKDRAIEYNVLIKSINEMGIFDGHEYIRMSGEQDIDFEIEGHHVRAFEPGESIIKSHIGKKLRVHIEVLEDGGIETIGYPDMRLEIIDSSKWEYHAFGQVVKINDLYLLDVGFFLNMESYLKEFFGKFLSVEISRLDIMPSLFSFLVPV